MYAVLEILILFIGIIFLWVIKKHFKGGYTGTLVICKVFVIYSCLSNDVKVIQGGIAGSTMVIYVYVVARAVFFVVVTPMDRCQNAPHF